MYARCRPMAQYELDRGCHSVVQFVDESCLKVASNRGEKTFEFDAAFGPDSSQGQVFEDTRRLVESCLDGFNVCLFACKILFIFIIYRQYYNYSMIY